MTSRRLHEMTGTLTRDQVLRIGPEPLLALAALRDLGVPLAQIGRYFGIGPEMVLLASGDAEEACDPEIATGADSDRG